MDHEQVLMHPNELGGRKSRFKFGVGVCRMSCRQWDRSPPCIRLMSSLIQEAPGTTSQSDFNQMFITESTFTRLFCSGPGRQR